MLNPFFPEPYSGSIEYKKEILLPSDKRKQELGRQMRYRVDQGMGVAKYILGLKDNGCPVGIDKNKMNISINNIKDLAQNKNLVIGNVDIHKNTMGRYIAQMKILEAEPDKIYDVSIAVAGNVDSGKSTTIGSITQGVIDNGRGSSRVYLFNHPHEIETGRTSSVGHQMVCFDKKGQWIKPVKSEYENIVLKSKKIVSFYDLAGHRKYLKTTIFGFTSSMADYTMITISPNNGVTRMTREHIYLTISLRIPFFIVITKIDIAPPNVLKHTVIQIKKLLKNVGKNIIKVKNKKNIIISSEKILSNNIIPVLFHTNTEIESINLLRTFINLLPIRHHNDNIIDNDKNIEPELHVQEKFLVTGIGPVISGMLIKGSISVGDKLWIGPGNDGKYLETSIKSMHYKRVSIKNASTGQHITLALKKINYKWIQKGMSLVGKNNKFSYKSFKAKIKLIRPSETTIRTNYQPVLHIHSMRQSVKIDKIYNDENLVPVCKYTMVDISFCYRPCFLKKGMRFVFREGKTRGEGIIEEIYY